VKHSLPGFADGEGGNNRAAHADAVAESSGKSGEEHGEKGGAAHGLFLFAGVLSFGGSSSSSSIRYFGASGSSNWPLLTAQIKRNHAAMPTKKPMPIR